LDLTAQRDYLPDTWRTAVPRWLSRLGYLLPRDVVIAWVVTRICLIVAGLTAPLYIPLGNKVSNAGPLFFSMWTRWDGQIYVGLAQHGYVVTPRSPNTAFFPLYPWLIQLLTGWSGNLGLIYVAAMLISTVALFALLAFVVALGRLDFDEAVGRRAAIYYLVFPTTLFLTATFAEALFLALLVGSFYFSRRGRFALAGTLGFFAALSRPYGVLLAIPLAWEAIRRRKLPIGAIGPILGPIVFFVWLWIQLGDPLLWFKAQAAWARHVDFPWTGFLRYLQMHAGFFYPPTLTLVDLVAAIALVLMTLVVIWQLPRIYGLYTVTAVGALLLATHFQSMTRWSLMVFPIVFLFAVWARRRWVNYAVVGVSFALALYFMARFAQWQWVA
jgi:hypothetical protein